MASELDLIPSRYRERQRVRRALLRIGAASALAVSVVSVTWLGTVALVAESRTELEAVGEARTAARLARENYEAVRAQELELSRRAALLEGLRGSIEAERMFFVVDRALDGRVWFREWEFKRAGDLIHTDPDPASPAYFVVIEPSSDGKPAQSWRVETHMEIQATAVNHSALAEFVRRLVSQPEVADARVIQTNLRTGSENGAVDFQLAVVINADV